MPPKLKANPALSNNNIAGGATDVVENTANYNLPQAHSSDSNDNDASDNNESKQNETLAGDASQQDAAPLISNDYCSYDIHDDGNKDDVNNNSSETLQRINEHEAAHTQHPTPSAAAARFGGLQTFRSTRSFKRKQGGYTTITKQRVGGRRRRASFDSALVHSSLIDDNNINNGGNSNNGGSGMITRGQSTGSTTTSQRYTTLLSNKQPSNRSLRYRSNSLDSIFSQTNNSQTANSNDNSSIDIMDFGVSYTNCHWNNTTSIMSGVRESLGMGDLESLCDSKGFLGWELNSNHHHHDSGDSNNNNSLGSGSGKGTKDNGSGGGSSRPRPSRGLSNRTILLDKHYRMSSERSLLSVTSECSAVTIDGEVESGSGGGEGGGAMMVQESSSVRWRRGGVRQESVRTLDSTLEEASNMSDPDIEEEDTNQQRGALLRDHNRYNSTRAVLAGTNNDSSLSSLMREDRRGGYTREESTRTLDDSVYSIDSKGFMTWNKKNKKSRGGFGVREEESIRTFDSGVLSSVDGNEEEEEEVGSVRTDDTSVMEEEKGEGLLVDWDQSKKKMSNNSLNECDGKTVKDDGGNGDHPNATSSRPLETSDTSKSVSDLFSPAQIKLDPTNNLGNRLTRRMKHMSDRLSSSLTSLTSMSTRAQAEVKDLTASLPLDLSDTFPIDEEGNNRDRSRRRGFCASNREESTRTFDSWAQTVNSADEKKKGEGLLVDWDLSKKEKSVLSVNDESSNAVETDGGVLENDDNDAADDEDEFESTLPIEIKRALEDIHYRPSRSNSKSGLSTNNSGSSDFHSPSRKNDRGTSDFQPAQIKLDPTNNNTVGNRLFSIQMKRMSNRLSSSQTSPSTRTPRGSWNLTSSLPNDQRDYNYNRHDRGSMSSWSSLALSDHGNGVDATTTTTATTTPNKKLSILRARSNDDRLKHTVPALSSSLSGEANSNNNPIRICREDNVNIEELRRELLSGAAGNNDKESRKKNGFNLFALT